MTALRYTGESLGQQSAILGSNEVRADRQIPNVDRVGVSASGNVNVELSYAAYDDLFEGTLMSDWSAALSISGTDIAADSGANKFTSGGTDISAIVVGQWIEVAGFANSANNGFFKVTATAANEVTVSGATLVTETVGPSVTIDGSYIRNGATLKSYTLEKKFDDVTEFVAFTGMRVASANLSLQTGSLITGNFSFAGKNATASGVTVGTGGPNAAPTNSVMNATDHIAAIMEGSDIATTLDVTGVSMSVGNALGAQSAVGSVNPVGVSVGTTGVSGTFAAYFDDRTLYEKYLNATASNLSFRLTDGSSNTYVFTFPAVRYTDGQVVAGSANQDVVAALSWQAYRDTTTDSMIQIDRF